MIRKQENDIEGCRLDEQAALNALAGQQPLLAELAKIFCEDAPQLLDDLQQAVQSKDAFAARRHAHSLKGLAATFYAPRPVELAQRIEDDAASGNTDVLTESRIAELHTAFEQLRSDLAERLL